MILGERLSPTVLIGLVTVIVGVALINLPARKSS
jgi:drug/metabolite transporter (DMT)-like permease